MLRLSLDFAASVPKDSEQPALNEDAWAADAHAVYVALSDGASISYDSRNWANQLVRRYVTDHQMLPKWVSSAVADYKKSCDYDSLSWSHQAAFDRGSFATLLATEWDAENKCLEVLAIGDSLAVHIRRSKMIASFPYRTPTEFAGDPCLLSTLDTANTFVLRADFFQQHSVTWRVRRGDVIYLCTDKVGEWLLREIYTIPNLLSLLGSIDTEQHFTELITELRREKRISLDDSTLIRLKIVGA